ncbi:response regulator [Candidatus Nitrospira neomarina]|uniref:Oxygen sensor histidine kinase NreB n=1 Tax=Candidatus Nitrospira neomarina TaxID=3020899 RepID=A0AA96GLR8_9BACT|nr:response regulator [Candidatus Nitrospira neomarina]WNM62660.1 response regulator [Candidatus Nitrospira neomarina]
MLSSNQMAEHIRNKNWLETPLGDMAGWPAQLKTSVQIILDSRYPMFVWWGRHLINIYNDAYIPILGNRHPQALGACASEIWSDVWEVVGPQADIVFQEGRSTWNEDLLLFMRRHGFLEETFFTFSYSPIKNEQEDILGLFCACTEETSQVLKGRRLHALRRLSAVTEEADSVGEVCRLSAEILTDNSFDIPFSLIYLWDKDVRSLCLAAQSGFQSDSLLTPLRLEMDGDMFHPQPWWPLSLSHRRDETVFTINRQLNLPGGPWPEPPHQGIVLPVESWETQKQSGYLIVGISPRLAIDDQYREFLNLLAKGISGAINRAQVRTEERKRIEALAELNRAKTDFFSNVSHEFRTPLTLILGSLEEAMQTTTFTTAPGVEVAHRNAVRMLKLVNTLLDFSSLEAGRMQAVFEPVDLCELTIDLASSFESAMKNAGLEFVVSCSMLSQPVYVDRTCWEKIMLNLLSNALKFTLQGRVSMEVSPHGESVDVRIEDSGVGMSRETLSHVFDRFFRAKEAQGRTFEGTGIGLALVKELVEMHGGRIHVESEPGRGSVFTVTVPFGFHHLPPEQVCHTSTQPKDERVAKSFILETQQWAGATDHEPAGQKNLQDEEALPQEMDHSRPTILLVEDNRDMRNYLTRLLCADYEVVSVCDGQEALERIHTVRPHLILSDIMMPRIDGHELLTRLRSNQDFQSTPFIFLSARAGQEAEIDGLLTGADDYLVKPFSGRELLARVKKILQLAAMRRTAIEYQSRFQYLAHHPEIMTWITDADGNCVFLSQTWYDLTGQTEATGLGEGWLSAIHPQDRLSTEQAFYEANRKRQSVRLEYRLRSAKGEYHSVLDSASPRFESDGRYLGYVGLVLDLSYQKDIEEQHLESEERFRTLANTISQFAWMADSTGWGYWYNARWYEYTGTTFKDMEGWGWRKVHHPDHVDRVVEKIRRCFQSGHIWEDTFPLKGKDGEYRWFLSRAVPIRNQHGEVVRWIGTNTDITELKTTQEQLQHLTIKLESQIAKRTEELRHNQSRLQALVGELILTEQRERRRIAEELHDFLAQLLVACRLHVNRLEQMSHEGHMLPVLQEIDRILNQSVAYTRSLVAQLVPSVLYQFGLLKALQWLAEDMKQYGLTVEVKMERDHLTLTENEAVLLFQSIRELMMNVVKHAGADTVYLAVSLSSPDEVCIDISDRGVGFDPNLIEKHSHTANQFGLFSIRERMSLLGGRMVIDSSPGSGTRIRLYVALSEHDQSHVTVPFSDGAPSIAQGAGQGSSPEMSSGYRVLLVDDHAVVRQGLRSLLDAWPDVEVVGEAGDGIEAIRLTESLQPDVVVMDINMPHMNGIDATRQIRQNNPNIQVIGLSVRQDKETEQAMREAGAAGYLSKETAGQDLYRMIARIARLHQNFS